MDWQRFLEENNIHFVSRGPNTKRGEVSIQCPMCGGDDPSEHLGINLQTGKWGCHRDASHRGKSPRTLIKAILRCSSQQAGSIVRQYSHADPETLEAALATLEANEGDMLKHDEDIAKLAKLQALGPQFKDFNHIKPRGITKRFFEYLQKRVNNPQDVMELYDLRCAMTGRYKDRIIIPVRLNGELMGWTSRAIGVVKNAPRYLASNEEIKTTIFNYDNLKGGGDRLFIVEGPFDAIKLDSAQIGLPRSTNSTVRYRATCTFGTSVTVSQIALLRSLIKRFNETWILFDIGAEGPAIDLAQWLNVPIAHLPNDASDPGELQNSHLEGLSIRSFDGYIPSINKHASFMEMFQRKTSSKKVMLKHKP